MSAGLPRWLLLCGLLLALGLAGATVQADSYDERRVRTAARLLRALLAADEGLEGKQDGRGQLRILLFSAQARDGAALRPLIAPGGEGAQAKVRGLPIEVASISELPAELAQDEAPPVAIFLAQPLDAQRFARLLDWCVREGVILYSPFEGDVERGATAGLSVQAKVQPFVNLGTLKASGIELRRFYLENSRAQP